MKNSFVGIACSMLAAAGLISGCCGSRGGGNAEADRAALRTADESYSGAAAAKDADAFAAYFAADGSMLPPNEPSVTGPDAIRAWASGMMASPGFAVSWKPATVDVSGGLGYTVGTYELHMNMPDGSPMTDHGKYICVWKKGADGTWKVAFDTFNSDLPMPAAPPAASAPTAL